VLEDSFYQIAGILGLAALAGLIATQLRQPLIVAFIAVGVAVGPAGLDWVQAGEEVDILATLGISVLLFLVGLKLDLHLIRSIGPVALATGLGQVAFTSGIGFLIALGLGLDTTSAVYVGVALTFSSTIIIVKLLSDKRELEDLHGRIAIGFLIVQDIVVVIVLIAVNTISAGEGNLALDLVEVFAKAMALLGGMGFLMRYVLPRILHWVARSSELLVLFAVAWAVAIAALGNALDLSAEVGAFVAGVALATTPYRDAVGSRLVSLRDFLLLFFFIELGSQLELGDVGSQLGQAGVLSAFVLIGNPIIVMVIMGALRYRKRVSFLAGLTVAQISEFSLIFAALGLALGDIDQSTVSLITTVGLITIGLSAYMILYSDPIYRRLAPALSIFERSPGKLLSDQAAPPESVDVVVYGRGRFGRHLVNELVGAGCRVVVVDFDPQQLGESDRRTIYGDAEDPEFVIHLPATSWVVSTIARIDTNLALLHALRAQPHRVSVALTAHTEADRRRLSATDADLVLQPFAKAAEHVAKQIIADLRFSDRVADENPG
jgi:Kef-type K+ transport system membrane component KefB